MRQPERSRLTTPSAVRSTRWLGEGWSHRCVWSFATRRPAERLYHGGVEDEGGAPEDSSPAPPGRPARTARTQRQVRVLVVLLALLLIGNGIRLQLSGHDKHKAPAVTPTSAATPSPTRTP